MTISHPPVPRRTNDITGILVGTLIVLIVAAFFAFLGRMMSQPVPPRFESSLKQKSNAEATADCNADPKCVQSFDPTKSVNTEFKPTPQTVPARR